MSFLLSAFEDTHPVPEFVQGFFAAWVEYFVALLQAHVRIKWEFSEDGWSPSLSTDTSKHQHPAGQWDGCEASSWGSLSVCQVNLCNLTHKWKPFNTQCKGRVAEAGRDAPEWAELLVPEAQQGEQPNFSVLRGVPWTSTGWIIFVTHGPSPHPTNTHCGHSQCLKSSPRWFWTFLASLMPGMSFVAQAIFQVHFFCVAETQSILTDCRIRSRNLIK